jgi:hypothetical protein
MKWNLITVLSVILICVWIEMPDPVTGNVAGGPYPVVGKNGGADRENVFQREPVLFFETTGYTFTGAWHERLAVYNDGTASFSRVTGYPNNPATEADFVFVPAQEVEKLRQNLKRAGAHQLTDLPIQVSDVPLTTVTFFVRPGPHAHSNTFNYFVGWDEWGRVNQIVDDFTAQHFPEF